MRFVKYLMIQMQYWTVNDRIFNLYKIKHI
jgi:hypothetical protein